MAINWSGTDRSDWGATTITPKDSMIKGEMITAQKVVTPFDLSGNMDVKQVESTIKQELMNQLVEHMLNKYYARIYVVPDEQVRILRDYKVK
jgi:hypothetical protein